MRRNLAACLLIVLITLILAGCGDGGENAQLTIYSGRNEELVGPLLEQFTQETGISVQVRFGDSADLALLISEEGEKSPADVLFSQSPGAVGFLAGKDLLARIDEYVLAQVDERVRNNSGLWVGVTGRQRVLVYNTEVVDPRELPASVFDLTADQYRGQVAIAPLNSSFQDFVTAMRHLEGDDIARQWLKGMATNDSPSYPKNSAIVEAISRGEVPMGLVNHYYSYRFLEEDPGSPTMNHLFPNSDVGALLMPATVSILASSANRDVAQEFIAFLLSPQGQAYFAEETFEYPLAPGVDPKGELPPLESLEVPEYDIEQLGGDLQTTAEMISSAGLRG